MAGPTASRGRWAWGFALAQTALLAATLGWDALGAAWWHHLVSFALVLLAAILMRRQLSRRRVLAIGVAAASVLAAVSGFWLLYWKEGIRADGYQDWGVFWHVAWSWAAAVLFWQHTWVNRVTFAYFFRESFRRAGTGVLHAAPYVAVVAALLVTWGPLRSFFTSENYISLSLWAWLLVVAPLYTAWWILRRRSVPTQKHLRGAVDLGLVPVAALALLSGIPLLWFDPYFTGLGLKYANKFWHVWPSVVFAALVFTHGAQLWNPTKVHWARLAEAQTDLTRPGTALRAAPPGRSRSCGPANPTPTRRSPRRRRGEAE